MKPAGIVRIVSITTVNEQCHISCRGEANFTYHIQTSVDLAHWSELRAVQADSTGAFALDESAPASSQNRFFRVYLP